MDALLQTLSTGVLPIAMPDLDTAALPLAEFGQSTDVGAPPPKPK